MLRMVAARHGSADGSGDAGSQSVRANSRSTGARCAPFGGRSSPGTCNADFDVRNADPTNIYGGDLPFIDSTSPNGTCVWRVIAWQPIPTRSVADCSMDGLACLSRTSSPRALTCVHVGIPPMVSSRAIASGVLPAMILSKTCRTTAASSGCTRNVPLSLRYPKGVRAGR